MLLLLSAFAGLKQRFSNRLGASASLFSGVGMINDSNSNYAVARFYCAIAIVSALSLISNVSFAAGPVSVEVAAGTTTYTVTNRTISHPLNTTVSAARDITPYVSRVPNGLAQSAAGDLIVATKEGSLSTRFTGKFIVSTPALKAAAKSVVRSAPYLGYGLLAYEGIEAVANANGWYIDWSTDQMMAYIPVSEWSPLDVRVVTERPDFSVYLRANPRCCSSAFIYLA